MYLFMCLYVYTVRICFHRPLKLIYYHIVTDCHIFCTAIAIYVIVTSFILLSLSCEAVSNICFEKCCITQFVLRFFVES